MFKINLIELKERVVEGYHPTANEGVELIAYIERLSRVIDQVEWINGRCIWCEEEKESGHAKSCEIGNLVANAKPLFDEDKRLVEEDHDLE